MRNNLYKISTAILALAITFTLSCSSEDSIGEEVIATSTTTIITYDANGGVSSTSTSSYEYKYNGGKSDVTIYLNGSMYYRQECKHYSKSNCTELVLYDANGNMSGRYEFEYDSKGNQTKQVSYGANGNMSGRYEFEYDRYGNQTKIVSYNADGSIGSSRRIDWNCNSDGSFCTYTYYNDKGEISVIVEATFTTINSKRLTVSSINTSPNGKSSKVEYEYDSRGNNTKYTEYERQSDTGNWVKHIERTSTYTYTRI